MTTAQTLYEAAKKVRENAHAKYSNFQVGACIAVESGETFVGVNVENASHPCGQCAEASAIGHMVSSLGQVKIKSVCVVGDLDEGILPCGSCLQRISEFSDGDAIIISANLNGIQGQYHLDDLLPNRFTSKHLG